MNHEAKVVVLGGGVSGLCAAHYAGEAFGHDGVLLLEAADALGGTTRTDTLSGFRMDWGPNGFLDREPKTLEWIDAIGQTSGLMRANEAAAKRFILKNEKLVEIQGPPQFLFSPLLSVGGRLRLLCEPFIPQKKDDAPESIWNFAARRIGRDAADTLVSCMVSGVFGGDAKQLSLAHCFPRMATMEREHGTLFSAMMAKRRAGSGGSPMGPGGVLTTFRDGIGYLPKAAGDRLGSRAITGNGATRIVRSDGSFSVETVNGDCINAKYIVVAIPTFAAARILNDLDTTLTKTLDAIPYADMAVVSTGYRREQVGHDLDGFGFLVPRSQGKRILGCLWTSTIFPHEATEGHVLLRTMIGGSTDPEAVRLSDDALMETVKREVSPLMRLHGEPEVVRIFRHHRGIPQYLLDHQTHLDAIAGAEMRHAGLAFAGNAYRGVGLNDCVLSARDAVSRLVALERRN